MSVWYLAPEQRLNCPPEFAERIVQAGGVNKYDEPNFRLVWGQSPEAMIRAGGSWDFPWLDGVEYFRGYRDIPVDGYEACWLLQQWFPADAKDAYGNDVFGLPASWYARNYDEETGLQILGGYPYSGQYFTIFSLVAAEEINGKKVRTHMPLNSFLVDTLIPIIVWSKEISELKKRAVIEEQKERREAQRLSQIEAAIRNASPALGEIRSAAGLACLSVVQKKMEAIERHWQTSVDFRKQHPKGISVQN